MQAIHVAALAVLLGGAWLTGACAAQPKALQAPEVADAEVLPAAAAAIDLVAYVEGIAGAVVEAGRR